MAYTKCPLSRWTASPCVAQGSLGPHCSGDSPCHQSSTRYQTVEYQTLHSPIYRVLIVFKPSPFSFLSFLFGPLWVFPLFLFHSSFFWGSVFPVLSLLSPSCLQKQKQLSTLCNFCLPQFTSLHSVPAKFCDLSYSDYCVNPQINFLGVQKWFGADLAAFQGRDKLRVSMQLCILTPPPHKYTLKKRENSIA